MPPDHSFLHTRTPSPSRASAFTPPGFTMMDSPSSDYYSDCRSPTTSPAQTALLHRLNRVGMQLRRRKLSDDTSRALSAELVALESAVAAPESQSRVPADVAEGGLFDDDDDEEDLTAHSGKLADMEEDSTGGGGERWGQEDGNNETDVRSSHTPDTRSCSDACEGKMAMEKMAVEAQALLARVTKVAEQLKLRHEEVRHINDKMVLMLDTASNEVHSLRSENEALKQDMKFNHSELLFLKLQLRAVELAVVGGDQYYNQGVRNFLIQGIERWKQDWEDIDVRQSARRSRYGLADAPKEPVDTNLKPEAAAALKDAEEMVPIQSARAPRNIISIKRPNGSRSPAAALPSSPLVPKRRRIFSECMEEGECEDDDMATPRNAQFVDSDASAMSADEDEEEVDDDDVEDDEMDGAEEGSDDEEEGDDALEEETDERTPWEELWDSLTEFVGMDRAD